MCDASDHFEGLQSEPRSAPGSAVDPIDLPEVDEVSVTSLVDNVFDALLPSGGAVTRPAFGRTGRVPAPQFTGGETVPGLRAEHGFSALVTACRGGQSTTVLFDTGASPDGLAVNAGFLELGLDEVQGVVLSHGHFDHAGGFAGLARLRGRSGLPLLRLTGVDRLAAVIGGFHLSGPAFEPIIEPTVDALTELAPALIVPGPCTGWKAQSALARALPDAWVQSSVGSRYQLTAA